MQGQGSQNATYNRLIRSAARYQVNAGARLGGAACVVLYRFTGNIFIGSAARYQVNAGARLGGAACVVLYRFTGNI